MDSAISIVGNFTLQLEKYAAHHFRVRHQFRAIREIRENLLEDEVLCHVDFSENYCEKFAAEVQAAHFGHRNQIVLHQGVMYMKVS